MTSKVKGQGRNVTWCVWQVLADKSRTKRPRNTKIGRTVAHPTGNNAKQFQGQRRSTKTRNADKRRHQASYCWDWNCIISTEREDIRTLKLVRQWNMRCQLSRPTIKLCQVGFLHAGEGIPSRPNPAATQLIYSVQLLMSIWWFFAFFICRL